MIYPLKLPSGMSSPTEVVVGVVIHVPNEDEWGDPTDRGEYVDERFSWRNRDEDPDGPQYICYGYEINDSGGKGQEDDWKQYGYKGHTLHIYGYALAWTWAGVIEFNKALYDAIAEATKKLKAYFPNETPQIIIRGQQR